MALADIYSRVNSILYGSGLGGKPAVRITAANANESTSGQLVTFSVLAGEGAKIKPGNVLSVYKPTAEADAHAILVTSIATDAITGVNGWQGAPLVVGADSGDLDSTILEQNPLVLGFEIFEAIDTIMARFLWPDIYNVEIKTIANPDLVDGQEAVAADVKEILHAWQRIGSTNYPVPFERTPLEVHTTLASTGLMATFDWFNGSTGYYTAKTKLVEADEATDELTHLIAVGAAALLLGASVVETTIDATKKDNIEAVSRRAQVGNTLWRDFLTMKQAYSQELGRDIPQRVVISRG